MMAEGGMSRKELHAQLPTVLTNLIVPEGTGSACKARFSFCLRMTESISGEGSTGYFHFIESNTDHT